jgi:hypothetical protein
MKRNMKTRLWMTALLVSAVCLLALPAARAAAPLATLNIGAAGLDWQLAGSYEKLTLTVSGPDGLILRREFRAGIAPSLGLFGKNGKPLPDGAYTYELTASPIIDQVTRDAMAAARQAGDDGAFAKLRASGKLPRAPLSQSGVFTIAGGSIVQQDLSEEPRGRKPAAQNKAAQPTPIFAADQVIPDDLIVQQSLCVGFDCVNNESFGFDTIRLKENSTRIKFEDTSTGTFPANDWQLTANDSASGGANKFSIEDITGSKVPFTITAGAATNSIFLDSTGRLGLKTSTPVLDIHIATSNTPAIRMEQNNSGGFTAQTWDIAGNEANFFVRDVTGGSRLPFRIRPGAPTSSVDITADGDVGIGTATADAKLTIKSQDVNENVLEVVQSADTTVLFRVFETTSGDGLFSVFDNTGLEVTRFTSVSGGKLSIGCNSPEHDLDLSSNAGGACNGGGSRSFIDAGSTSFTASSSRTLKENLTPVQVPNILDKISSVGVYNYDFIDGPKNKVGLMAEDFHTVLGNGSDKLINGQDVEMALWLAVQELTARNKELATRLADLEARLATDHGSNSKQ